jgi:hypothetical protein
MDLEKMTKILKGQMKGQAVMEYLITYGLALFVILIVLAILVAVVLPQLKAPDTCQFSQPGFGCSTKQHVIVSEAGTTQVSAIIQLDNQQSRDIVLNGMLCSGDTAGNIVKDWIYAGPNYPDTYGISMPAGSSKPFTLNCRKNDIPGGSSVMLAPGSSFKGSIALLYNYADEVGGAPERMAVATITGTVQAG